MRRIVLTAGLTLLCSCPALMAQVSLVNPVPHEVSSLKGGVLTSATELFDAPSEWRIVCEKARTNGIAAQALEKAGPKNAKKAKFTVTIGVKGDKSVKKYGKLVADKAEGYYLEIKQKEATIVGADEAGLYYGVQTLLGIMAEGKLQEVKISDWPDVKFRGVVEGFYGQPWSHTDRLRQLDFYGRNKMNVYIYGPKDDPFHRDHWRDPYPADEGRRIQELVDRAKQRGVNFYWAIHPGIDIKWTTEDRDALMAKLEKMYALGVRSFAVFFDDIWGEGTKADKQAALLNYIDDNFVQKKHDVSPLVMCPTEYNRSWANDEKGYLRTLGTQMNKGIEIMWTGNSVVHCIDKESMAWINSRIDRKAYIWWNFPVSDFVRDHMLMGPAYGNGLDIADDVSGFVSNPMQYAEASKIALYGIADYTWNMQAYDYKKDWEKALRDLLPENAEALRTFALYNKDLGPNGHGFRREEGDEMKDLAGRVLNGNPTAKDLEDLQLKTEELARSADVLLGDKSNPGLVTELRPWLLQAKNVAAYGQAVTGMAKNATSTGNASTFKLLYDQARSLQEQMYNLENDTHVLNPYQTGIKLGTKVLMPTLNQLFAQTVNKYNAAHGTGLNPVAEYNPFVLTSDVSQLAQLPVTLQGSNVSVTPSNEVINWQAGGSLTISADREITLQGMDFNLGVAGIATNFKLEVLSNGTWKNVSLLHYKPEDPVIHTGNELGGMKASALRLTNTGGKDLQVYFKSFKFVKQ